MSDLQHAHVQKIYRPVSVVFILLVLLLIAGVIYTGWSSTIITVTPRSTTVKTSFTTTVSAVATTDATALVGTVKSEQKTASVTVTPKTTGTPVPAHATGDVTIKNTTAKAQPLTTGTRLKSVDGIIVRTTARVDVPAGGSVVAHVIADPLGDTGNVAPGKFVIVALWPGLQDKIYGDSTVALAGGMASGGTTLSIDDLTAASDQATAQIRTAVGESRPGTYIDLTPDSVISNPKPEVASASYTVTVTMNVTTVTYDTDVLNKRIQQELTKTLPINQDLDTIQAPTISLSGAPTKDSAVLQIDSTAAAHLAATSPLIQPATFTGLTADAIKQKLSDASLIKNVNVKLSPIWRTTAPDQAGRITVTLLPAQL